MCQEFCPRGGGMHAIHTSLPYMLPLPHMPPPPPCTPHTGYYKMQSMSGRYASYWNAFLFYYDIIMLYFPNFRFSVFHCPVFSYSKVLPMCHGLSLLEMHSGRKRPVPWCRPTSLGVPGAR